MVRARCLLALALATGVEARQLAGTGSLPACRTSRSSLGNVQRLRGGADAAALGCMPWLRSLMSVLFPGNPERARSEVLPQPKAAATAPSPPAAKPAGKAAGRRGARAAGKPGSVVGVHSKTEFDKVLKSAHSKQLVVVDFFATWCGPCKQIAPKYEEMAAAMPHVKFVKVDVDECKEISQAYSVTSMPTFKMLKGGKEVGSMAGADENALREKISGLAGKPDRWASAGSGRKL